MTIARGETVAISVAADAGETPALVGGMQIARLQLLQRPVVQTSIADDPWQRYASLNGRLSLRVEGTGILLNDAAQARLWNLAVEQGRGWFRLHQMQREITGDFVILKYEILGRTAQLQQFTLQLESAGKPAWSGSGA